MGRFGFKEILLFSIISIVVFIIRFFIRKGRKDMIESHNKINDNKIKTNSSELVIPQICPHCKSPNTKLIRLCEWCGSQIV